MTELYIALGITQQRANELTDLWNALGRKAKSSADCIILLEEQPDPDLTSLERIFLSFCYGIREGRADMPAEMRASQIKHFMGVSN